MLKQDSKYVKSLAHKAKSGNISAFEQIYKLYSADVFSVCKRMAADKKLSEQLTADAFLNAWENISAYRDYIVLNSWLNSIAVYTVLSNLRRSGKLEQDRQDTERQGEQGADKPKLTYKIDFEKALLKLPQSERFVFILFDILKYSYDETADFLFLNADAVKLLHTQARKLLIGADKGCNELANLLDRYADGKLTGEIRNIVELHLQESPDCRNYFLELTEFLKFINVQKPKIEPPAEVWELITEKLLSKKQAELNKDSEANLEASEDISHDELKKDFFNKLRSFFKKRQD